MVRKYGCVTELQGDLSWSLALGAPHCSPTIWSSISRRALLYAALIASHSKVAFGFQPLQIIFLYSNLSWGPCWQSSLYPCRVHVHVYEPCLRAFCLTPQLKQHRE